MTITEFWDKYKGQSSSPVSVQDFWGKYKERQAEEAAQQQQLAQQAQEYTSKLSPEQLSNMFGSYVTKVDPAKYGGYTQEYWQAAMAERIASNPDLAGKSYMMDFGGQGTQYKNLSYQYSGMSDAEPYNEERLGFNAPTGAWVWTGEGDPEKLTGSWTRDSDQDPRSYGWEWVSAFDPDTMKLDEVSKDYRSKLIDPYWQTSDPGDYDINFGGKAYGPSLLDPNKTYTVGGVEYTPTTRPFWGDAGLEEVSGWEYQGAASPEDGGGTTTLFATPEQFASRYLSTEGYYLDPTQAQWGTYQDPGGREGTTALSASGYLPDKGDYSYGPRNWFEGFMQRNGQYVALAIFTAATAGAGAAMSSGAAATAAASAGNAAALGGSTTGALTAGAGLAAGAGTGGLSAGTIGGMIGGGVAGALGGGVTTGQKTNDPWRIIAGAGAGAIGGAVSGGAAGGGFGLSTVGNIGLGASTGAAAGMGGTYAATGDINKSLRSALIGGASGGLAAAAAPITQNLAGSLTSKGVSPLLARSISQGATSAARSGIMGGVTGNFSPESMALSGAQGAVNPYLRDTLGKDLAPVAGQGLSLLTSRLRR